MKKRIQIFSLLFALLLILSHMTVFAATCDELLGMAETGEVYDAKATKDIVIPIVIAVVVSLALAFFLTYLKLSQMKTANRQEYANDYIKSGSMNIEYSGDIFLYSHISRRAKPKSNNSGSSGGKSNNRSGSF